MGRKLINYDRNENSFVIYFIMNKNIYPMLSVQPYEHILKYFQPRSSRKPSEIGQRLGHHVFVGQAAILVLSSNYEQRRVKQVFFICEAMWLKSLCITFNSCHNIPKHMQQVNFPVLEVLDLSCNGICSIEPMKKIFLPKLTFLNLQGNKVSTIRCLSLNPTTAQLRNLSLNTNKYPEYKSIVLHPSFELELIQLGEIPIKRQVSKLLTMVPKLIFA